MQIHSIVNIEETIIDNNNKKEIRVRRFSSEALKNKNKPHRVFIECHRGVNKEETENTLAAFEKAIHLECDSIELDIWLTKDKIPIVIHGTLDGKLNENSEKISNYIYSEIIQFDLVGSHKIPKLEDVFKLCKHKIFLNIEIKDPNFNETFNEVYKLIVDYHMQNQIAISSFHHDYYEQLKIKNLDSLIEFGFLYDIAANRSNEIHFNSMNSTINLYYKEINEEIVSKAHENNIGVLAWFYMTDDETEDVILNLIKCKVDIICTNDPRKILNIISNL